MQKPSMQSIGEVIHKEKKQKKYNETKGQCDNVKKYTSANEKSMGQREHLATTDKVIKREANYIKNLHIDATYDHLRAAGLITSDKNRAWWCGTMHKLGVEFVKMQADRCINSTDVKSPPGLFHYLINARINKAADPYMPRFNR